ncbi:MAG: 50S ribosomal protein L25/general stress protein Ctc [Syntrophobacteraceae bacterium]|nr:50S ribosomal protein L25/general stress protein Ctc [Desulfobacteraceae bacterium]
MDVELNVKSRSNRGKGAARSLRREERVPAILYGPKTAPVSLSVGAKRLEKLLRDMGEESKLLQLNIEDGEAQGTRQVLIREVQVHPFRRRFLHVDFYEVPLDQAIEVAVPVEFVGEPIGVKKGGMLNSFVRTLTVRCLPAEIPDRVQIDVAGLDLGDAIHVGALSGKVPFELVDDPTSAVVNITAPEAAKEAEGTEG